jgi:hypothetical protein
MKLISIGKVSWDASDSSRRVDRRDERQTPLSKGSLTETPRPFENRSLDTGGSAIRAKNESFATPGRQTCWSLHKKSNQFSGFDRFPVKKSIFRVFAMQLFEGTPIRSDFYLSIPL